MIKVIKYGHKRRIECKECGSLIEYEKEDIKCMQTGMNEYSHEIECPVCKDAINIPARVAF